MSLIPARFYVYAALLLGAAGWLVYERLYGEHVGAAQCHQEDKTAALEDAARVHAVDQETIRDLQAKLAALPPVATPATPPPRIRVCVPAGVMPAAQPAAGTQPGVSADRGAGGGVLPGRSGGEPGEAGDIGPGVQALRDAGAVLSVYRAATWDWSVRQAGTPATEH